MSPGAETQPPWLRIVIVAYRSGGVLGDCVASLAAQTDRDFEVVIVDNEGVAGSAAGLDLPDSRFSVLPSGDNLGFAGGTNRGAAGALSPWIMALNPDTSLEPDALAELRRATRDFPDTAMFSPVLYADAAHSQLDGLGDTLSVFGIAWRNGYRHDPAASVPDTPVEVFSPTGAAALYRREGFERAGGFDERMFCYLEDVALGLRLRAMGERCLLIPAAKGVHLGGHSTKTLPDFALRQTARNGALMLIGAMPLPLLVLLGPLYGLSQLWLQWRGRGSDTARVRRAGCREGRRLHGAAWRARLSRKPYPLEASWRVLRRLSLSLPKLRRQAPVFWDVD